MTWLALCDPLERRFSLSGIGGDRRETRQHPDDKDYLLARGSIVFEARVAADAQPHALLSFEDIWPKRRGLTFHAIPGGGISVVQIEGDNFVHGALQHAIAARTETLRVTFSWDEPKGLGRLTVERPGDHYISSRVISGVRAMQLQSLKRMFLGRADSFLSKELVFAALSDCIEPVGPMPNLSPQAMVLTPWGYKAAGTLKRGDTIVSRDGTVVPVLDVFSRIVPARGSFRPIQLTSPFFGLLEDVIVSAEQRLVIDGSEVEYLFNEEAVLVPAKHLMNGYAVRRETAGPVVEYVQLLLPMHQGITVAGTHMESLFVGTIRRKANLLNKTILRGSDRHALPEHEETAYKELKWHDAVHLARQRAA